MTPSRLCFLGLAGFAAALVFTGLPFNKARAFTYESASGVTANGGSNLVDPDAQFEGMTKSNSMSTTGGITMQFGAQDPQVRAEHDYQSGVNRMFNPLGRPPGD